MSSNTVRTRFAPSPSGYLHVGGARTALYNYLYAAARGGQFILRVEDTDQERSSAESERLILDSLKWLGIEATEGPDEGGEFGPYRQSERLGIYEKYTKRLIAEGHAYPCFCDKEALHARHRARGSEAGVYDVYDGHCRDLPAAEIEKRTAAGETHAVRMRVPEGEIVVKDLVQGKVKFNPYLTGDFVIVKSDGYPAYNYAVVVDDHEMKITHVIRGVGHLSNTPRQIVIQRALGISVPEYAHISEIVGTDGKKLSKRRGATSVLFFRELGFLSDAFVNYMALLGWSPESQEEFLSAADLRSAFDVARCKKAPATFDFFNLKKNEVDEFDPAHMPAEELAKKINNKSKLLHLNNRHIREKNLDEVFAAARPFIETDEKLGAMLADDPEHLKLTFDKIRVYLSALPEALDYMREIFKDKADPDEEAWSELRADGARGVVETFRDLVREKKPAEPDAFRALMKETGEKSGAKGKGLFMPIRVASTGSLHGLELPSLFSLLGPDTVVERIEDVLGRM